MTARLGPFELVTPLAEGGMGSVWQARYVGPGAVGLDVAFKRPNGLGFHASGPKTDTLSIDKVGFGSPHVQKWPHMGQVLSNKRN